MKWISNNDPPLYVWEGDTWYNQKNKCTFSANIQKMSWDWVEGSGEWMQEGLYVVFPKKTRIMNRK